MVKTGQPEIQPVAFNSTVHPRLPVEVVRYAEVLERCGPHNMDAPHRPSFPVLILAHAAGGTHTVDFSEVSFEAGRMLRILPGQVHRWETALPVDATLVLSRSANGFAHLPTPMAPSGDLSPSSEATALALVDALRAEQLRFAGDAASVTLMTRMFSTLEALFTRAQKHEWPTQLPPLFVAFRAAVEQDLSVRNSVAHYAEQLGYSERTLSRACRQATGLTAKGLLVERLVLEAKRLLVHTDEPAASIANQLGFSEATNFQKFFVRCTGQRPSEFRAEYLAGATPTA
jgi:AraC-like DNA-binding protein